MADVPQTDVVNPAFDMAAILRSKHAMRSRLAALPIEGKLRFLEQLRERQLTIAASRKQIQCKPPSGT